MAERPAAGGAQLAVALQRQLELREPHLAEAVGQELRALRSDRVVMQPEPELLAAFDLPQGLAEKAGFVSQAAETQYMGKGGY